jgi:hypothetical protein
VTTRKPRPRPMVMLDRTFSSDTYHTQGYGAARYAQVAAESHADVWRDAGYPAEVFVLSEQPSTTGRDWHGRTFHQPGATVYGVRVPANAPRTAAEVPVNSDITLLVILARVHKRGGNPLVFTGGWADMHSLSDQALTLSRQPDFTLPTGGTK